MYHEMKLSGSKKGKLCKSDFFTLLTNNNHNKIDIL